MTVKCVVVASQSRARFFIQKDIGKALQKMADMTNNSAGDAANDAGDERTMHFAKEICARLKTSRSDYDKLVLIAPPEFLSVLKECLPDTMPRLLVNTLSSNVIDGDANKIQQFLKI